VISSDLERASITGDLLAEEVGCPNRRSDIRWRENHAGDWQGLTRQEINQGWPGWLDADKRPSNFESVESTTERTLSALADIVKFHPGGCILVVSHGGVIRLLRRHFTGKEHRFPNLSGSWFEHDGNEWQAGSLLFPLELIAEELRNTGAVE
jgi:broad specificity phosphatase PhoE